MPQGRKRSPLTRRDQLLLRRQAEDAKKSGIVQLRFLGMRYLELTKMEWTPATGLQCTVDEFDAILQWWGDLWPRQRKSLMKHAVELPGLRTFERL